MPRKPRNLYLRGGTYWGRFKVAGREYRGSLRTADAREAARRLKAWRSKTERESLGEASPHTFEEAVLRWTEEVLPRAVKPNVAKRYLSSIAQLDAAFAGLPIDRITGPLIAEYAGARGRVVTNATILRDLTALSRLLANCVAWGWIASNPASLYDRSLIREHRDPITPPDDASVDAVIAAAPPGMARLLRLLRATGMREGEAVNLERHNVDWQRRQITLIHTKTNRPRTINWATVAGDAGPVLAEAAPAGVLFRTEAGNTYRNFSSNFANVIREVGAVEAKAKRPFRRFRVHDLRHGFAIKWMRNGGDIYALSHHLGHTSVKTTEIYLGYASRKAVAQNGAQ